MQPKKELQAAVIADGGGKILIVLKDPVFGSTIAASLAPLGHTSLVVPDTATAVPYLRDFRPDLVLMDTNFPHPHAHAAGVEWREFLLLCFLQQKRPFAVPFIVISGDASALARDQALAAGATDFFSWPLDFGLLLASIRRALPSALA